MRHRATGSILMRAVKRHARKLSTVTMEKVRVGDVVALKKLINL